MNNIETDEWSIWTSEHSQLQLVSDVWRSLQIAQVDLVWIDGTHRVRDGDLLQLFDDGEALCYFFLLEMNCRLSVGVGLMSVGWTGVTALNGVRLQGRRGSALV